MNLARFVAARLARLIATFLIVTFATTAMLSLVPGDPAVYMAGETAPDEVIEAITEKYGFDDPIISQYAAWLGDFVRGDLGTSYRTNQPVLDVIRERLPVTLELAILATGLALAVAVPLAIASAQRQRTRFDRGVTAASSVVISLPSFVVALLLLFVVGYQLEILPVFGWTPLTEDPLANLKGVILPVVSIALGEIVVLSRVLRSDLIDTLQQDFIALARAKGLSTRAVMWKHALRPSSFSIVTLSALQFARLLGGTVVIESIFLLPGLGSLALQAISSRDLVQLQGVVAFVAVCFLAINFLVDLLYGMLDPRTRVRTT